MRNPHVPRRRRHNMSDKKSYTEVHISRKYSIHIIQENTLLKAGFLQLGHIAPWGHKILVGPYEMIITFEPP